MTKSTNHRGSSLGAEGHQSGESVQQRTANIPPRVPTEIDHRSRSPEILSSASTMTTYLFVDDQLSPRERRAHVMREHNRKRGLRRTSTQSGGQNNPTNPPAPTPTSHGALNVWYPSPATSLDSFRKDPFDSLPAVNSLTDQELADAWVSKLSYWSGQNHYIKFQIYKTAIAHPVCFQAVILAYCARWRARLYRHQSSPEVEQHLLRAATMLEQASHQKKDSNLAMAFAGMSLHENRFGDNESAAMNYEDQAVGILRMRGRQDPKGVDEVFLHYVRILKMPREFALSHDDRVHLVHLVRGAKELKRKHNTAAYLSSVPQRRTAFQMASPLFCSLCPGPWPTSVPQGLHKYVIDLNISSHELSRTACLIYITTALWEFQHEPDKTSRFLAHLNELVAQYTLDRNPACETFIWLLIEERCSPDLRESERAWRTGELLKRIKQLPPVLRGDFSNILFSYLMLEDPAVEAGEFEREIFALRI
ncbi:uncharacterized protein BP01DRAFT_330935 [Aspergillus saccharolyticus JOP 1030-1]|uniref:Uncharacterized protein n=1 Tax=Aspergillus saccharolyticus JOP 1030-1 TaxID=1450539 RepID=A0A318ZSH3_9EURO|nr:hypothetical protein BP01DRAFT_330935 [Aspergillus saccharolyticus JOP 1030-1]PYH49645.1 hypothetical protein BP01DRAFT_330935 [Aspergillus saccharolyticus JOP 1030-1]